MRSTGIRVVSGQISVNAWAYQYPLNAHAASPLVSRCPRRVKMCRRGLALLVIAFGMTGCAGRKPGDPLKPGYNVYTKEQDIQLGLQAAQQVVRQVDIVDNSRLQQYVVRIGKLLASQPGTGG